MVQERGKRQVDLSDSAFCPLLTERLFINQPAAEREPTPRRRIFLKEDSTLSDNALPIKTVFSRKEAAVYLGIHVNTLDMHSEIPRIKIGGRTLFKTQTLEKYLSDMEKGASCKK
jgi:hypothetical protein